MENNTTIKVPKKYHEMIQLIEQDSEGYWAYANEGYYFQGMGCKTAHEYNQKELLAMIRTIEVDETEEDEQEPVESVETAETVESEDEPVEQEESYISEVEIMVDINSYVQGIHLNQEKTYSTYMDKEDKQSNEEKLEQLLYVALYRLDENVVIDTRIITNDGKQNNIVRIVHKWGKIELRKAVGGSFEIQEEYEREGNWKKRIKDFIKSEFNNNQEGA